MAALIFDKIGRLYGTTYGGGDTDCDRSGYGGCGAVFELMPSAVGWIEVVVHRFSRGRGGFHPRGGLYADSGGALYGTTSKGGVFGHGTVFKLTPSSSGYSERTLYNFRGGSDGDTPFAELIGDRAGALYGTTELGGSNSERYALGCGTVGCGTVFKLTPSRANYVESILHRFLAGNDGALPFTGLLAGRAGALYGTTGYGGGGPCNNGFPGCGVIFRLTPRGAAYSETILHSFTGPSDALPLGTLVAGKAGTLYGTTIGTNNTGTVFELTPTSRDSYTETVLHTFVSQSDGSQPHGRVAADRTGTLYGTTATGGTDEWGTIFKIAP
jgi:uncharacterized repeat protein (TIGR03803 family)